MGHTHADDEDESGKGKRLLTALVLNVGITVAQIVGGVISGSLSVLADAAHNASDAASLGISYGAWLISKRRPDQHRTFGYRRAETIGALINLTTLFVIALYLLYEAGIRFLNPQDVGGWTMIIVGVIAAVEDALSVWVLSKDRGSLNVKSAFLHMIADTAATFGVIIGGILILLYDITWVDPLITAAIAIYIFVHAFHQIRSAVALLMESAPEGFDVDHMVREMTSMVAVEGVHHVHVWQLDEGRTAMEAHIAVSERDLVAVDRIRRGLKDMLRDRFGVAHATLEVEFAQGGRHDRSLVQQE
jgi:cobalt-zinc-cadmium efflux system protein